MPKLQPKEVRQNGHVGIQRMAWKVPYILGCIEYHKSFKRFADDIRNIVYLWSIYEVLTVQRRTGNPRPTKSRSRVKCSGFNFAHGSESPFVHCTQPYGFACQPLRGLVTSRNGELSTENAEPATDLPKSIKKRKHTYRAFPAGDFI